jgi:hypothetical protein
MGRGVVLEQGGELITGSELAVVAHRRLTDAEEIEACWLYADQRRTLREIAQLYGLTPAGVLKILIRNNIARRSMDMTESLRRYLGAAHPDHSAHPGLCLRS